MRSPSSAAAVVPSAPSITQTLAQWAVDLEATQLPGVTEVVHDRLLDYLANLLAGAHEPSAQQLTNFASRAGSGPVPLPDGTSTSPEWAALPYGGAVHVLECDDTHLLSSSHPGAVVLSALLPLAIATDATWQAVVASAMVGYEVMGRVAAGSGPANEYARGFHPTGTCRAFGAAAAAARLLGADESQLTDALGIVTSFASGSMTFLYGRAWTKHTHPGWAAHAGLTAARLAVAGFPGPVQCLEGRHGYLVGHSDAPDPAAITAHLGTSPLVVETTSVKAHECCRYEQSALAALLELRRRHDLQTSRIEQVRVGILAAGWNLVADPIDAKRRPATPGEAQFSMPFGAAVALLHGRASVHEHREEHLADRRIHALMDRVTCFRSEQLDRLFPARWPATVEVVLDSGEILAHTVDTPKGDPGNPFTREELWLKLDELNPTLPSDLRDGLKQATAGITDGGSVGELARVLRQAWVPHTRLPGPEGKAPGGMPRSPAAPVMARCSPRALRIRRNVVMMSSGFPCNRSAEPGPPLVEHRRRASAFHPPPRPSGRREERLSAPLHRLHGKPNQ